MRQKGFTLLELLVAIAVGTVLLTGSLLSLHQVLLGTTRSRSQVTVLADVNQAALAVKKDLFMTQTTNLTDGNPVPQSSVTLTWVDYTGFESENYTTHTSIYTLSGTNLLRNYDGVTSIVGRHITSIGFTRNDRVINVIITAAVSGTQPRSETLRFTSYIRSEPIE